MPLYTATSIIGIHPILAAFMGLCMLVESITKYDILALLCAFSGVLMINDPFKFFNKEEENNVE